MWTHERDVSRSPRGSAGSKTLAEIMEMLVQRERARFNKDWSTADTMRQTLSACGVSVFDKTGTWRSTDGLSGKVPTFAELEAGASTETLVMAAEQASLAPLEQGPVGETTMDNVKAMVKAREQARAQKDFAMSDKIRDDLKALGVELLDKEKIWKSSTGACGIIIGYGSHGVMDMEITTLVVQREKARQSGDWALADMIRDELKEAGCEIYDKEKVWRTKDGRSGAVPSYAQIQMGGAPAAIAGVQGGGFVGTGAYGGGDVSQALIQAALKAAQNPSTAAMMLAQLSGNKGAYVAGGGVRAVAPGPQGPEARDALSFISQCQAQGTLPSDQDIEWLVKTRERIRQNKDFAAADNLRNQMKNIGIEVWEKEKTWKTTDGRQGIIPSWNSL